MAMCKTMSFLVLVVVMALTACGLRKTKVSDASSDSALRSMLGIRSLTGSVVLPPGEDYYAIAVCNYEDGKLIKRSIALFGGLEAGQLDRQLKPQLLWGNVDGKLSVSVSLNGSGGPYEDHFWSHLNSGWLSIANTTTRETSPDGWVILGYGCSNPLTGNVAGGIRTDFRRQLEASKYVGALEVRTFKSKDDWRRAMADDAKPAQGSASAGGA